MLSLRLKWAVLLIVGLSLNSCWAMRGKLPVEKISETRYLLQAQPISVPEFFSLRMQNRPRKAMVGNWLVLYEDQVFVYLGYPHFDNLNDQRSVETLYRISKAELQTAFPAYRRIEGNDVRLAAQAALQKEFQTSVSLASGAWQADLGSGQIHVTAQFEMRDGQNVQMRRFRVNLNATDLTLISLHEL